MAKIKMMIEQKIARIATCKNSSVLQETGMLST